MYVLEDSKDTVEPQTPQVDVSKLSKVEQCNNGAGAYDTGLQSQPPIPADQLTIDVSTIEAPDSQLRLVQNPFAKNSMLRTDQNQAVSPLSQSNLDEYMFVSDEENEAQN